MHTACVPIHPPACLLVRAQFAALLSKFRLAYWRTPSYNFVRLAITVVVGLVYGSIYWGQGDLPDPASLGNMQVWTAGAARLHGSRRSGALRGGPCSPAG